MLAVLALMVAGTVAVLVMVVVAMAEEPPIYD